MTRRIVLAITAVTVAALAAFGIPLGIIIQRQYRSEAILELERQATAATIEVPSTFRAENDPIELPPGTDGATLAVYLPDGQRVAGAGPEPGGEVVEAAAQGSVADGQVGTQLVVAVPVTSQERVFAVVRAAQPHDQLRDRVERAWLAMGGLALGVAVAAFATAIGLARRLQRPVDQLIDAATVLGSGDFSARAGRSGITELDRAADALDATAERIGAIVERERAFSADASHQLRTPLTAMRVHLHQAEGGAGDDDGGAALSRLGDDLDRLEQTTHDLLRLARDSDPRDEVVAVEELLDGVERHWHGPLASAGRRLTIRHQDRPEVRASTAALRQILDVLIDNALRHGSGTVTVTVREVAGGCAVDVHDEGARAIDDADGIFAAPLQRSTGPRDRPGARPHPGRGRRRTAADHGPGAGTDVHPAAVRAARLTEALPPRDPPRGCA